MATVHTVHLQELPSTSDDNYYVTLKILPQNHRSFQTKAVKRSKSLEFKEKFEFRVTYEKLQAQSLKMMLCSFDRFSQHESLGEQTVHLADLEERGLSLSREITLFRDIHAVQKVKPAVVCFTGAFNLKGEWLDVNPTPDLSLPLCFSLAAHFELCSAAWAKRRNL